MAAEQMIEKIPVSEPAAPEAGPQSEKPEHRTEQAPERKAEERPAEKAPQAPFPSGGIVAASQARSYQERRAQEIDSILAEGLHEVFLSLSPEKQREFKQKGEETVSKISALLDKTKVKVSKIIDLIRGWLQLVPGINRFFLEQEAKIKADKIMKIKNKL